MKRTTAIATAKEAFSLWHMRAIKCPGFHTLPANSAWFAVAPSAVYIWECDDWCILLKANGRLARACRND